MRKFLNTVARLARQVGDELKAAEAARPTTRPFTGSWADPVRNRTLTTVMIDMHGLPTVNPTRAINPGF
jgi:hypothetical protein